ncbi:triose-phosphate isomerase [Gluconobacter morbifer]|nr:triose-phosphate isomerase [Gluconobacter morbifer]
MDHKPVWVGTSWKMNKGPAEAITAARSLELYNAPPDIQPFVIPPFTSLKDVCTILHNSDLLVGAQNMHWDDSGAWTGEISPSMIRECGAALVEIGHSERREHFGETDWTVNRKVRAAVRHGLRPLVCVGDTSDEYEFGVSLETLARQTKIALHGLSAEELPHVLIAYEPVWAIGTKGRAADKDCVAGVHAHLRRALEGIAGEEIAACIPLLYGGSVTLDNAYGYVTLPNVDGVFVGRAAWEVTGFKAIIDSISIVVEREVAA